MFLIVNSANNLDTWIFNLTDLIRVIYLQHLVFANFYNNNLFSIP